MKGLLTLGSCSFLYKYGVSIYSFRTEFVSEDIFVLLSRLETGYERGLSARKGCLQVDCRYTH